MSRSVLRRRQGGRRGAFVVLSAAALACSTAAEDTSKDQASGGGGPVTSSSAETSGSAGGGDGAGDGQATTGPGNPSAGGTDGGGTGAADGTTGGSGTRRPAWIPTPGTTWQWQLTGTLDLTVDAEVFDIDLFDSSKDSIAHLHDGGQTVICYFSAGTYEDWRPDAGLFPEAALGSALPDWPGERWVDHRDPTVRQIMSDRLDLASTKGCDAVEPDNVDGYANDNGLGLTADDQTDYNLWLADQAHARGLSVGLKNDLDQVDALAEAFDWALNEECMVYDECDVLVGPFIDAGKAVFHVEYVDDPTMGDPLAMNVCGPANDLGFSTIIKGWDLDAWRIPCW